MASPSQPSSASSHPVLHEPHPDRHPRLAARPSVFRPSSLLHQQSPDGILDPSRSAVVTPESAEDGHPSAPGGRRGTISKGYKGRGRGVFEDDDTGSWEGEEDDSGVDDQSSVPMSPADGGEKDPESVRLLVNGVSGGSSMATSSSRLSWASGRGGEDDDEQQLRITIERPSTPQISANSLLRPTFPPAPGYLSRSTSALGYHSTTGGRHRGVRYLVRKLKAKVELLALQMGSLLISTVFLGGVVTFALVSKFLFITIPRMVRPLRAQRFAWDDQAKWKDEKIINDPTYYARSAGFDFEERVVESEDGFFLKLQQVIVPGAAPRPDGRGGFPVLIMHGLFQSSGSFITSEERSLAFWLAKQGGYQVFLGNTRGVFDMGHRTFKRNDPRFWDWTIRELAMYDLPALVDEVRHLTGYDKIGFIGHSQGNGTAFISLSLGIRPDLGPKLSCFVALAPAVFAGPLTTGFPFTALGRMEWRAWRRVFGVLDFIPIMTWAYNWAPQAFFASLGYTMFAFLFDWTDANWLLRRKGKMFRFTPSPVSSASIFWWAGKGGFATRKCLFDVGLDRWFDERFPPLSIYWGGRDYLVLTEPLIERLATKETCVNVIRTKKLNLSEHCDFYWAAEAVEWCYWDILEDLEKTRPRYPEEEAAEAATVDGDALFSGVGATEGEDGDSEPLIRIIGP